MKKILWCACIYTVLPLCAMNPDQTAHRYDGIPEAGQQNVKAVRTAPCAPVPSTKPSRKHPDKIKNTKRPPHQDGTKSAQARNKDLIAKTRLIRALFPITLVAGAALAVSEHKARRAGKQTMLQRLWYKIRRIIRKKADEKARGQEDIIRS